MMGSAGAQLDPEQDGEEDDRCRHQRPASGRAELEGAQKQRDDGRTQERGAGKIDGGAAWCGRAPRSRQDDVTSSKANNPGTTLT